MLKLGLIGGEVSRSQSPKIHPFILDKWGKRCSYEALSLSEEEFLEKKEELFARFDAFNVTTPYKERVLPLCRSLRAEARAAGAVNLVLSKSRTGCNTDGEGFLLALEAEGIRPSGMRVLVLGAGGAGRSLVRTLHAAGAEIAVYSRTYARAVAACEGLERAEPLERLAPAEYGLAVNCTGIAGALPAVRAECEVPFDERFLSRCEKVVDLIYSPAQTEFLRTAARLGKRTINGGGMLFFQAYLSDCEIVKRQPETDEARRLYRQYREEK